MIAKSGRRRERRREKTVSPGCASGKWVNDDLPTPEGRPIFRPEGARSLPGTLVPGKRALSNSVRRTDEWRLLSENLTRIEDRRAPCRRLFASACSSSLCLFFFTLNGRPKSARLRQSARTTNHPQISPCPPPKSALLIKRQRNGRACLDCPPASGNRRTKGSTGVPARVSTACRCS